MRVRKRTTGTDVHYIRGAMGETVAVFENNTPTFYNILAGEEVIGQFDGSDRRYYVKDHLGSTRMTINNSQGIDGYQDYYPFGKINLSDSRRMPGRSYTSGNLYDNYKFTGHACPDFFGERDDEFDLTLDYTCPPTGAMQARMYDPVIGRFLSVDPASHLYLGNSPYNYVLNNPINAYDPNGLWVVMAQLTGRFQIMGSISASIGLATDQYGNIGLVFSAPMGIGYGGGATAGLEVNYSPFLESINDLSGMSFSLSAVTIKFV